MAVVRTLIRTLARAPLIAALCVALPVSASEAPSDPTLEPRPAEIMPLAPRSILLGVAESSGGFVAVGERGHILHSADGSKWTQVEVPVRAMLTGLTFATPETGWAVGYDATILKTTDGGRTWKIQNFDPEGQPFFDVLFLDPEHGIAVGKRSQVMETRDGGESWDLVENEVFDFMFHVKKITRLYDDTLLLVGERGLLVRSTDRGETWEMLESPYVGSYFGALPLGDSGAVLFGLRGNVYVTPDVTKLDTRDPETWDEYAAVTITDPGELEDLGWRHVDSGTGQSLFGGTLLDNGEVLLVGVGGSAVRSENRITRFVPVPNPYPFTLVSVITHGVKALAVGQNGSVLLDY